MQHKGIEIWARPITPLYQSFFSYGIAFLNRRTDGTPSDVAVTLAEMGLVAPGGYRIQVQLFIISTSIRSVDPPVYTGSSRKLGHISKNHI